MQKYLELYISVTNHPWNKRANSRKEAWNLLNYKWSKANPVSSFVIHTSSGCEIVDSPPFPLNSKIGLHMLTVQAVRSVGGQGYPGGQGSTCFEDLCTAFHGRDWTPDHKFNEFFFEGCGAKVKIQALEFKFLAQSLTQYEVLKFLQAFSLNLAWCLGWKMTLSQMV